MREVTFCIIDLEHSLFQGSLISNAYSVFQRFYTGKSFLRSHNGCIFWKGDSGRLLITELIGISKMVRKLIILFT